MDTATSVPSKSDLTDFLDSQVLCTVSSIGEGGYPNAASVAFSSNDNLEFVIGTSTLSRKAANFARDAKVSLTITDADKRWTVQLEGDVRPLGREEFESRYSDKHYKKLPFSLPFKDLPDQTNFLITPVHMKLTEANVQPWRVTEF